MVDNTKFFWGDVVKVTSAANSDVPKGVLGTICGITQITNEYLSNVYGQPIGSYIYTVEFSNGVSFGLAEIQLEKA